MHHADAAAFRYHVLQCVTGAFGLMLIAVTWRLWTPQDLFPQVPLLRLAAGSPAVFDYLALLAMIGGLASIVSRSRYRSAAVLCWLFPIGFALAVALDQHRLQPWAYQISALAIVFSVSGPSRGLTLIRLLTVGIYGWSAVGKFDFQFVHTVGSQMIEAMTRLVGVPADALSPTATRQAAFVLPVGELMVAILLIWRRTRRTGVAFAVALHTTLIVVLGPLGLGHQPGVLIWNGFFAIQAVVLFWPTAGTRPNADAPREALRGSAVATVAAMLLLPVLERFDRFDHWPSWALYAPHSSRATIYVSPEALASLPPSLVALLEDPDPQRGQRWVRLPIDRWSLRTLGVPVYPQDRFQLGVALALARDARLDRQIRVELRSTADRFSGLRETEVLVGRPALQRATRHYFFSATPR